VPASFLSIVRLCAKRTTLKSLRRLTRTSRKSFTRLVVNLAREEENKANTAYFVGYAVVVRAPISQIIRRA
jgi:hypothetical protein